MNSLRILLLMVAGLLCVLLEVPECLAQTLAFLTDIASDQTDPKDLSDAEPSIAVNPVNPSQIAVVTFSGFWDKGMAPVWKSSDGGITWGKVFQIPQPTPKSIWSGPDDQKIAFDSQGNLFVAVASNTTRAKFLDFVYRQTGQPDEPLVPGQRYNGDQLTCPQLSFT